MQSQYARMAIAVVTVAIWMAVGWIFHLDANAYLVVGIPYLLVFQLFVARRPVTELWLREPSPRGLPWWTILVALALLAVPMWGLARGWDHFNWPKRLWSIGSVLGALPLAWAVVNLRAFTGRCLLRCFLTAGLWGVVLFGGVSVLNRHGIHFNPRPWYSFGVGFLLFLPVCFLMEEVFFRGGLDSFVHRPGDRHRWLSAVLVSVLWSWWHLPITGLKTWGELVFFAWFFPVIHLAFGLSFSMYWRRSGSLLVPAAVHSFIDAFRNVVM
jgi:membrane protease YdiL (CAAX protease family)